MDEKTRAIFKPCEAPGKATVEDGIVLLDGPDGVAVAMTAQAAAKTGESLLEAAAQVLGAGGDAREGGSRSPSRS